MTRFLQTAALCLTLLSDCCGLARAEEQQPEVAESTSASAPAAEGATDPEIPSSSVGMPRRITELVLSGTELEAKQLNDDAPVVLRIVSVYPHGTAFRYELEFYGLEPGQYDLRDYLVRKDASSTSDLPSIPIEVVSLLPKGQILPKALSWHGLPRLGGYRVLVISILVAWVLGLLAMLAARKRRLAAAHAAKRERSVAEKLRPLIERAVAGVLTPAEQAEMERLLLGYWSHRLGLDDRDPTEALAELRNHEQAGTLLRQVEAWLHQPGGARSVDIAASLAPYRDLEDETAFISGNGSTPQSVGASGGGTT